jgi:hypothetical protein
VLLQALAPTLLCNTEDLTFVSLRRASPGPTSSMASFASLQSTSVSAQDHVSATPSAHHHRSPSTRRAPLETTPSVSPPPHYTSSRSPTTPCSPSTPPRPTSLLASAGHRCHGRGAAAPLFQIWAWPVSDLVQIKFKILKFIEILLYSNKL